VTSDEQAIRAVIDTWMKASEAGERDKVLGLMDDDVVFLVTGHPPMRGKAAFAAAQKGLGDARIEASADIQEVRVLGEWAYVWNRLSVAITPPDGAAMKRSGDVLSVFRKRADGSWVLFRDANLLAPER
jgi:uncharacterized protein (TIGR02246 family)